MQACVIVVEWIKIWLKYMCWWTYFAVITVKVDTRKMGGGGTTWLRLPHWPPPPCWHLHRVTQWLLALAPFTPIINDFEDWNGKTLFPPHWVNKGKTDWQNQILHSFPSSVGTSSSQHHQVLGSTGWLGSCVQPVGVCFWMISHQIEAPRL